MEKYEINEFKKKLKDFREKKKYSVNKVNQLMKAEHGTWDHRNIDKWEDPGNNNLPNFGNLIKLCNLYDCDIDHFFGNLDYRSHINESICQETGLTEPAVDILRKLSGSNDLYGKQVLSCINELLSATDPEHPARSVFCDMFQLMHSSLALIKSIPDSDLLEEYDVISVDPSGLARPASIDNIGALTQTYFKDRIYDKLRDLSAPDQEGKKKKRSR